MGDPSDDDVPTMTSSADLQRDEDGSGADADDRTLQKPPDAVDAIEAAALAGADSDRDQTVMSTAPKTSAASPISSPSPVLPAAPPSAPRPAAGLPPVPADKLPPPPTNPLRPRMPSSPALVGPPSAGMRPRAASSPGIGPASSKPVPAAAPVAASATAMAPKAGLPIGSTTAVIGGTATAAATATATATAPADKPDKKSDSKSDVRTMNASANARSAREADDEGDGPPTLESEPPPSEQATSPKSAAVAASLAPTTPKMPGAPKTPPKAPRPSRPDADGEPADDSITATAPRVPAPNIPLSAPKQVQIRTLEESDEADQTEVKTLTADAGEVVRSALGREKAGGGANTSEADALDDSVTAQAPLPPSQMAGKGPPAIVRVPNDRKKPYNAEEDDSVTARGLEVGANYSDDSVVTQAAGSGGLPPSIDGETEGTTKRVTKKKKSTEPETEADERDDSVTAAAPGHLTNMLRVIASPNPADADDGEDDDDSLQAHTQVMANAPVKPPPDFGARRGAMPRAPDSESGLRASNPDALGGDRASLGALGVPGARERRHSGPMRTPYASNAEIGPSPSDGLAHPPFGAPMDTAGPEDRKPPYALLVGIVALISIAIPVGLFVILSQGGPDPAPRVVSQPSPDPVGLTGSRPKAKPSASPSGTIRNTGGQGGGGAGGGGRGPFRR